MIWHGQWADPELEHDGRIADCYSVESAMWDFFKDVAKCEGYTEDELGELGELSFCRFCQEHKDKVYWLIEMYSEDN